MAWNAPPRPPTARLPSRWVGPVFCQLYIIKYYTQLLPAPYLVILGGLKLVKLGVFINLFLKDPLLNIY